jgi:lipopolysaccharide transport system permease protein
MTEAFVPGEPADAPSLEPANATRIVIEPSRGVSLRLRDVWAFRELLYFLFWRDLKVRYKQTVLGGVWAILQPVATTVIFTVVLGRLARVSSDGIPYSLFALSGLLPWQLFSFALTASSQSLVSNTQLITKVYFPRLIIPISSVLVGLVDFMVASTTLAALMAYHHVIPTVGILILPLLVAFVMLTALAVGLVLSALNVQYRDVRHAVPFLIQIWMFATPVVYPSSLIPAKWRTLYGLNPMAGAIDAFRWALWGARPGTSQVIAASVGSVLVLFFLGLYYFRRVERNFADLV